MNSLLSYGSDDDYDDSPQHKKQAPVVEKNALSCNRPTSEADVNYEEVQMDLSEDSSGSPRNDRNPKETNRTRPEKSRDDHKERDRDRKYDEERYKDRDGKYKDRDEKERDRYRGRDEKHRDRERNRDRHRDDRRRRSRSSSRDRRSRSPARKDYRRSRSSERTNKSRRYGRASNKMAQLEKLGIAIKNPDGNHQYNEQKNQNDADKDRFYMPGITGRFKDQIERRKLLWQKKDQEKVVPIPVSNSMPSSSRVGKVWETTTFAQDQDGKVANKFKRLMGIKEAGEEKAPKSTDVLKKQEEMFHSMEQQYEVARTATHTMRGVGLGFGSYQR